MASGSNGGSQVSNRLAGSRFGLRDAVRPEAVYTKICTRPQRRPAVLGATFGPRPAQPIALR